MKHIRLFLLMLLVAFSGVLLANQALDCGIERANPSGNHVQVASTLDITDAFTFECWIYPTDLGNVADHQEIKDFGRTIFSSSTGNPAAYPLLLMLKGTQFRLRTWQTTTTDVVYNSTISINQWYHVAVTSTKGGTTKMYLDGVEVISFDNAGLGTWNLPLTIGAIRPIRSGTNLSFAGRIDEVRVWNYVKTQQEINDLKDYMLPDTYPNLIGNWSFEETSGVTAYDTSGEGKDGVYANFTNPIWVPGNDNVETLPIELSSFTAVPNAQYFVELHWITQSETNVAGFRVYRSNTPYLDDAEMFSTFVEAHNTSDTQFYTFVDEEIYASGTYYYWLENVDMTGNTQFHGPVIATVTYGDPNTPPEIPAVENGIQKIFPNPFNPTANIMYTLVEDAAVSVNVYNLRGQLISNVFSGTKQAGTHTVAWNGVADSGTELSSGIYTVTVKIGNKLHSQRVVLSK